MGKSVYGSTLAKGNYREALEINDSLYRNLFRMYVDSIRNGMTSRAEQLRKILDRQNEIGRRICFRMNANKHKGGNA